MMRRPGRRFALGLTLVVVAALGIVTSQKGSRMRYSTTIAIARPAAAIFPLLTEPEGLKQWIGGLESSIPLTDGGLRLGARSRETVVQDGRRMAMDSEVVELDPPRRIAVTLAGTDAHGLVRYTLDETGGDTTLRYEIELRFRGLMALFAPLARGPARAKVDSDLARLKALAESTALSIPTSLTNGCKRPSRSPQRSSFTIRPDHVLPPASTRVR